MMLLRNDGAVSNVSDQLVRWRYGKVLATTDAGIQTIIFRQQTGLTLKTQITQQHNIQSFFRCFLPSFLLL